MLNITEYLFGAHRFSDRLLVLGPDETLSYADAYRGITAVCEWLASRHVSRNDNILLWADNSAFFIQAYFGILRAGCRCVPIDPKADSRFLEQVIQLCRPVFCFVHPRYVEKAAAWGIEICSDLSALTAGTDSVMKPAADTTENDTAAIIFTSGSTGAPRGVMLSHGNIRANTEDIVTYQGLTDADIHQVVLPFSYCFGASLLHTHVAVGGGLVLNSRFMFPDTVPELVEKYGCTGFSGVPAVYQILCRRSTFLRFQMPSLRFMAQAGGPLPQTFIETITDTFPEKAFFVMYGQTEATARLSYLPPELIRTKAGSIGRGLAHTRLAVVDADGQPVSPGEEGEIVAWGPNVMQGYYQNADVTATRLIDGCLKTGDLATVDADGFIYITGRQSGFIKSAGVRISPHRVEAAIAAWENVLEVSVTGVSDPLLGEAVKAVVVPRDRRMKLDPDTVIDWCRKNMPEYMVPRIVEISPGLPRNSSGKIIRPSGNGS
jgi:acyl-CoA synthetase (AMP-forming)/AMP-acid ligase II